MNSVVVVDYDPLWPKHFESLATAVAAALGPISHRIEHIGSTAVPGMAAKPIIDLDVVVAMDAVQEVIRRLETIGYIHKGDQGIPGREAFRPPVGAVPHHLYVCPSESRELAAHLLFRDSLRADSRLAEEYAHLKRTLAIRFNEDRAGYCEAKTEFVWAVLGQSLLHGRTS